MILPVHNALRSRIRIVLADLYQLDPDQIPDINVQYPPKRTMGDLGITIAFELARKLRKAPRAIATEIVDDLGPVQGVERAEAAPNGYVNVFLHRSDFARRVLTAAPNQQLASTDKVIVEHTAINPNKAAHIGHLRNAALGDTLVRVLRFLGTPVEVQNYIDDTGVQVADIVVGFQQLEEASHDQVAALADQPRFDYYCWDLYARVTEWYDGDAARLEHRARTLHNLEVGANPAADLGQLVADRIVRCHLATMSRMNIHYDLLGWEGDILRLHFWSRAFAVLKEANALYLETSGSQAGCWVMPIEGITSPNDDKTQNNENDDATGDKAGGNDGGPKSRTKVIVRSNGTVTYVGKDIAYQFWKFGILDRDFYYRQYDTQPTGDACWSTTSSPTEGATTPESPFGGASAVYNVIDTRQSYLQQLLKQALNSIGRPVEAQRSVHVSYEMVALSHATARTLGYDDNTDTSRPFVEVSGRRGRGVKADDLLDRLTAAARREVVARHNDLTHESPEATAIATTIAVAAVRYFMIKYSRGKLIAFDIDEALSFEGESGPYVQYAVVRAANILRKLEAREGCGESAIIDALATLPTTPLGDPDSEVWALILEAARLDEIADQAVRTLELSVLAKYAFGLAQLFNTFYHRCPVVSESNHAVRLWRAAVVLYCRKQLTHALKLMGCEVPSRM